MNLPELALQISREAHNGQTDIGGAPYLSHPVTVSLGFVDEERQAAALLHDVVEDNPKFTLEELWQRGIPQEVVDAVDALTKRKGQTYESYLAVVKANPIARDVKIADLTHNMDLSRIPNPTQRDYDRVRKYERAMEYLRAE